MRTRTATVYRPSYEYVQFQPHYATKSDHVSSLPVAGTELADPLWTNPKLLEVGDCPIYDIVEGYQGHRHLRPRVTPEGMLGPMASGNVAHVDGEYLPIHDRFETQSEYDILSR